MIYLKRKKIVFILGLMLILVLTSCSDDTEKVPASKVPTMDEISGEWSDLNTNSLTVVSINIPWDEIQSLVDNEKSQIEEGFDSECDFLEIDMEEVRNTITELVGTIQPMTFTIDKKGETQGVFNMTSFPEDEEGQCEQATEMPLPFTYENGLINFDAQLLNEYIASQNKENLDNLDDGKFEINKINSQVLATIISETKTEKNIGIDGVFELIFSVTDEDYSLNFSIELGISGQRRIYLTPN